MRRVILIIVGVLVIGGAIVGFVLLTNGDETPAVEPPPPDDGGNAEPPGDQNPPPEPPPDEPPPDPTPLLTLISAKLTWDIGDAECVMAGETLVPTLTVCVQNDGEGEAEIVLLSVVVSEVEEGLGGTPYDETFASEPLAPGEERCLSATVDPATVTNAGAFELASNPDAEPIPLELPEMPPLCEPEPEAQPAPVQEDAPELPEGQFTEPIAVFKCRHVGGDTYEWYKTTGIFATGIGMARRPSWAWWRAARRGRSAGRGRVAV